MRRDGKARRQGIAPLFCGGATRSAWMQRRSNANELLTQDTGRLLKKYSCPPPVPRRESPRATAPAPMRSPGRGLLAGVFALAVAACSGAEAGPQLKQTHPEHPPVARASGGMVVTGSSYATEAGLRMLSAGGNAVDAAVAAAFALTVAEPTQSGLGGRTQMLIRTADGSLYGIDGTTQVPLGYDPDSAPDGEHGHGAIGIPGTVAALTRALAEHGTLPLQDVMTPAIGWAQEGVRLTAGEAARISSFADQLDRSSPIAGVLLNEEGRARSAGEVLIQVDLARTLRLISRDGRAAFYEGEIASAIASDMAANGGFVTLADLAAYRAVDSDVATGTYRGHTVVGTYLPASGVTVIEILQILDRVAAPEGEDVWGAVVVEALLAGFADRDLAERLAPGVAAAWISSDSLADRRAAEIAARLTDGRMTAADGGLSEVDDGSESGFTTHISVADTFGTVVALTQSLGPSGGARVVSPRLGFLYASTLGGYLLGGEPGYRPWSSQAPLVVMDGDEPLLVMGGAGSRRILSALVGTVTRFLDQGMSIDEALAAPRLHPTGGVVQVQTGWLGAAGLEAMGYRVERHEPDFFARLNVVHVLEDGSFVGVGEPRWMESAAAGPPR